MKMITETGVDIPVAYETGLKLTDFSERAE